MTETSSTYPLSCISDLRSNNGVTFGDFHRYQQYCSRRLHRVRNTLRHTFPRRCKPKPLTVNDIKSSKFLWIPLLEAERAWAHAMFLKQLASAQNDKRVYHHAKQRLSKAVKHAEILHKLVASLDNSALQKESALYLAKLQRFLAFERKTLDLSAIQDQLTDEELSVFGLSPEMSHQKSLELVQLQKAKDTFTRTLNMTLEKMSQVHEDEAKATEVVRLLEELVYNCEGLPLDHSNTISIALRSLRVFYVALAFVQASQYSTAMDLFSRASGYLARSVSMMSEILGEISDYAGSLNQWVTSAAAQSRVYQVSFVADAVMEQSMPDLKQNFFNPANRKLSLITWPPVLEPVHVKPLFLDLALNTIQFPDLTDRIALLEKQQKGKSKLFGWRR
ncbi:hypothetical protein RCL1_004229 [Eukaryota sp. TZLM3-RCL]